MSRLIKNGSDKTTRFFNKPLPRVSKSGAGPTANRERRTLPDLAAIARQQKELAEREARIAAAEAKAIDDAIRLGDQQKWPGSIFLLVPGRRTSRAINIEECIWIAEHIDAIRAKLAGSK